MKLIELKNDKGQAAMTDSLFFLTIIVALSVLLFKFSSTYGERVDLGINNLYFKEYTNSVLKSIYYTDMPLDTSRNVEDSLETDYLITAIKSDYLVNEKIGASDVNSLDKNNLKDISKYNLFHTIKSLMYPLPNYDYIFYIQNQSDGAFIYFMLKINYIEGEEISTNYYLCDPVSIGPVRSLVQKSNKIYSSSTPLLFKTQAQREFRETRAVSNITIWPSTSSISPELLSISDQEHPDFENITNLRCKEYIEESDP